MSAIEQRARTAASLHVRRHAAGLPVAALLDARRRTLAKFLLAIYTARYLGLADLGMYGLLVGATTIVPAVVGLGMTEWTSRRLVDLPRAQALPLIASRLSLTLSIHLVVQPLAFAADILLGEPVPLQIALLCGGILLLENLGAKPRRC